MSYRLKDLAKELGVSPATVSLALHNRRGVSEETKQRIYNALRERGFEERIPSRKQNEKSIRLLLYKNGSNVIGDTPFFLQLIRGVERKSRDEGFDLQVSYLSAPEKPEDLQLDFLQDGSCDGYILLGTEMTEQEVKPFSDLDVPFVVVDANFESAGINCVAIGNVNAVKTSTEYLIGYGHRKIGYLKSASSIRNFDERFSAFQWAMRAHHLEINPNSIIECPPSTEGAYAAVKKALGISGISCTAFIADNDHILFGAVKAFKEYQVQIPERVSLIGFDDLPLAELHDPGLTTVRVPKQLLGMCSVQLLLHLLEEPQEAALKVTLGTDLVERGSVCPPFVEL